MHGAFLPADGFLLKDRTAERQHNFSLQRFNCFVIFICTGIGTLSLWLQTEFSSAHLCT